jgi:hypothetical protein
VYWWLVLNNRWLVPRGRWWGRRIPRIVIFLNMLCPSHCFRWWRGWNIPFLYRLLVLWGLIIRLILLLLMLGLLGRWWGRWWRSLTFYFRHNGHNCRRLYASHFLRIVSSWCFGCMHWWGWRYPWSFFPLSFWLSFFLEWYSFCRQFGLPNWLNTSWYFISSLSGSSCLLPFLLFLCWHDRQTNDWILTISISIKFLSIMNNIVNIFGRRVWSILSQYTIS